MSVPRAVRWGGVAVLVAGVATLLICRRPLLVAYHHAALETNWRDVMSTPPTDGRQEKTG